MSQNDFVVANADGATVRADINSALQALASQSSAATEPATMYAHQMWADTTANLLKIRNSANNAWVTIASWDGTTYRPIANTHYAGAAGGTANAQTLTPAPALGAYAAGVMYTFLPVATNTSGTVTVAVSGLATRNIKKFMGGAVVILGVGDLIINGPALIVDDGTQFILLNPNTYTQGADVASATTTNLDTATGDYVNVTGTTTITGITLSQGRCATVQFSGILTLTHGASLVLPGAASIITAAGDTAIFRGEASGVVRCISFQKAQSSPVAIIPQNSKSAAYTTVLSDAGKHIFHPAADTTARVWTIDSNANVPYPIGTAITFINETLGGVITISITSDTLLFAGAGTTGSRTLAASNIATAVKITSTKWIISGSSGLT